VITDGTVGLRPMAEHEIEAAHAMSLAEDTRDFIFVGSLESARADFARPGVTYLSIVETAADAAEGRLAGYFILVLEDDRRSVECRRVVIQSKDRGTGRRAMRLLERYCRDVLERRRIWLDVFDFNARGRHVYESLGYRFTGRSIRDGKTLLYYDKRV